MLKLIMYLIVNYLQYTLNQAFNQLDMKKLKNYIQKVERFLLLLLFLHYSIILIRFRNIFVLALLLVSFKVL